MKSQLWLQASKFALLFLVCLCLAGAALGQASKRVVYYYQTLTDLSPVLNNLNPTTQKPYATDIIVASFHLGAMSDGTSIHLNNLPPEDASFNTVWQQVGQLQTLGVSAHMMLGGAAKGSYSSLFGNFSTYYPVLKTTIQNHKLNGIDLDVEETVSLANIEMLINQLRTDFGSTFLITLAPVSTDVTGSGGLSGFDYVQLYKDVGSQINWFNVQYYSGFGTLSSTTDYDNAVSHGFPASKLVAGMLGATHDGSGFVDPNTVATTVKQLVAEHSDFGGVDCWEYFDAMPGGSANPQQWSSLMAQAMVGAVNTGGSGTVVNLSSAFNISSAIVTDGTTFTGGGFDVVGNSYSASLMGSGVVYGGIQFTFGPANAADAVSNATVTLPSGVFSTLNLLAAGINGSQVSQSFIVTFTDGSTQVFTQSMSDWAHPANFAGETVAVTMAHRDVSNGTTQTKTIDLYGYAFTLTGSKTVKSISLPNTRNVVVMAMTLTGTGGGGTPVQASLSGAFNREGVVTDGTTFAVTSGMDGKGYAYSSNLLGSTLNFNGASFSFGAANISNVVNATGQTITLPAGKFSSLRMLGTGVNGNQATQTFTVHYSDASTATLIQSISNWNTPQSYSGESTALAMAHRDKFDGTTDARTFDLFGYSFSLDNTKTVSSITLPNNSNVEVLAITLVP